MFYKENNLKNVETGEMPDGWSLVKFETLCSEIKSGGTPPTSRQEFYNGNIPFVKIEDISTAQKYLNRTKHFLTEEGLKNSNAWIVPPRSLLVAIYGSLGVPAINTKEVTTNQAILGIIPNTNASVEYLYYLFSNIDLKRYAKQTTQANLTAKIIRNVLVPLPPLYEQQKIAEILSNIDVAIKKTTELITATERLKNGLMQTLLTRGIDHKSFKKTAIGKIPEEWSVGSLQTRCLDSKSNGGSLPQDFAYVDVSSVSNEDFKIFQTVRYTVANAPSRAKKLIHKDDIIFATVRPTLKRIAKVPEELDGQICSTAFCIVRVDKTRINPDFIFYTLQSNRFIDAISIHQVGATYPAVSDSTVLKQFIAVPSLQESNKIAEIISVVDKKRNTLRTEKNHLEKIKKGFMNKLLSGRIRVK